ncbi:MAG TPA: RNA polymerase factor sigma-54 [Candidatus Marinimicrobia bacterium]|jgi:RNA polymerase sigma-54 factor|nr:RNA polymerase factor sigma-54 [Candidatus Neomarinimicrobiota bacterium]MDP7465507.1 RNA polymerase factor sigma-54 [Candidatus Neomarinimicrobiota bacterium]HJM84147.1 RNA polymerase factor sigma-54 [Candidatus Neomarinimicrobiota bacterium]
MPKISQKLSLKQQLSPQQVLQASLLQLNLPLLEQRILQELELNPALEMMELPDGVENEENPEEKLESEEEIEFEWEELLGVNDDYEYPKAQIKAEEERESPLVSQETMSEKILKQVQDCNVDNKSLRIAEEVLGNLDEQGYLTIEPMLISDRIQVEEEEVLDVMHLIQRLDPPGLASVNMQDCLLAQAEVRNENNVAIEILRNYFDDFVNHRYEKIMENISCSKDDLNEAMEFIARLNPSPRDDQTLTKQNIVVPDIAVEDRNGKFYVVVQDGTLPEIRVSRAYINMLNDHKDQKDVRNFVKKKLESATWFVDAVEQRKMTIQRVMESIIKRQPDYFHSEKRRLQPMILKDIANDIEMDISTVSRVTNGKYVQLPWEIKELKTFFSEGIKTDAGDDVSNTQVKTRLKEMIDNEDKQNPIGDEELTNRLKDEGYKIARRTITKYREQLKFPTARLRRKI